MVGYAPSVIGAQPDNNCRGPPRHNETTGTQCADPYSASQPTSITQRQGLCQALRCPLAAQWPCSLQQQCLAVRGVFIGGALEKKSCPWRNSFFFYFIFCGFFLATVFLPSNFFSWIRRASNLFSSSLIHSSCSFMAARYSASSSGLSFRKYFMEVLRNRLENQLVFKY